MAKKPIATFDKYESYRKWKDASKINTYYLIDINTKKIHVYSLEKVKGNAEGS